MICGFLFEIVNGISLGFVLLFGQRKDFEDTTLDREIIITTLHSFLMKKEQHNIR